jgi:hypothetical protein
MTAKFTPPLLATPTLSDECTRATTRAVIFTERAIRAGVDR